jgi:hypothetical protein
MNRQAREAQAALLRAKGYPKDAEYVEQDGWWYDPDALENLSQNDDPS